MLACPAIYNLELWDSTEGGSSFLRVSGHRLVNTEGYVTSQICLNLNEIPRRALSELTAIHYVGSAIL
jgi:hypothetical protein